MDNTPQNSSGCDRDKVIGRIRKLLALSSDNPNANEAVAAALKAQKLMADYDVRQDELRGGAKGEPVIMPSEPYKGRKWRSLLAVAIAGSFRCRCVLRSYRSEDSIGAFGRVPSMNCHHIEFVGYEHDAEAALLVYNRLVEVGERLALQAVRKARAAKGDAKGVQPSFLAGFVDGVRSELEKQSVALMISVPAEVEDFYTESYPDLRRGRAWAVDLDGDAEEDGRIAGRDAVRSGRIGESDPSFLLSGDPQA